MRTRVFPESNYFAIQDEDFNIFRFRIADDVEIGRLKHPDVVDISLGTRCNGGCPYCYASANRNGVLYSDVVGKVSRWLRKMSLNDLPFQVAIGGGGEPTLHPELPNLLMSIRSFGVIPSYTTAGITTPYKDLLEAVVRHAGGVAVTAHPHIHYAPALQAYLSAGVRTNIHCIVGQPGSVRQALRIRHTYPDVHTVVLLPLVNIGYAKRMAVDENEIIDALGLGTGPGYAIGAMFSHYRSKWPTLFEKYSMFDEHKFSGYMRLDNEPLVMRNSSFDERERIV